MTPGTHGHPSYGAACRAARKVLGRDAHATRPGWTPKGDGPAFTVTSHGVLNADTLATETRWFWQPLQPVAEQAPEAEPEPEAEPDATQAKTGTPMLLYCPACKAQHVCEDGEKHPVCGEPDAEQGTAEHLCEFCYVPFTPLPTPTVGVDDVPAKRRGRLDGLVLAYLHQPGGTTAAELRAATGWQNPRVKAARLARQHGMTLRSRRVTGEPLGHVQIRLSLETP